MIIVSLTYFYLYARNQMSFMKPWGFAWLAVFLGLVCLLIFLRTDQEIFLEIRKTIDMYSLLFLLSGVYTYMHLNLPSYWYRFSLYMVVLSIIVTFYDFDILTMYYPITVFQFFVTGSICYNIIKRWEMPCFERAMITLAFILWGIGNPTLMILEQHLSETYILYIGELILAVILHFCILLIYIQHITRQHDLGEYLYKKVVEKAVLSWHFAWRDNQGKFNVNRFDQVKIAATADKLLPREAVVIADTYGDDTNFLFQTKRHGFASLVSLEEKISYGATYLIRCEKDYSDRKSVV